MSKVVFLGGTYGNNNWREGFIKTMVERGVPTEALFNPVVPDWTPECQVAEEVAKANADYLLFYIASPQQEGIPVSSYSLVEATMALYDNPSKAVVVFDTANIEGHNLKAVKQAANVLTKRFEGKGIFATPTEAIDFLAPQLLA